MGAESFQKRERERKRQARAAERRQRRENRGATDEAEEAVAVDTDALMERFRILSEQHAGGQIDSETYEAERTAIFEELGLN